MATYQVPHYATVGVYIMFRDGAGLMFGMPVSVSEVPEGGIEAVIQTLIAAAAGQGLTPLTEEEYNAWAGELAAEYQRKRIAEAMRESARHRGIDPARLDAILAAHKGPPGGDA